MRKNYQEHKTSVRKYLKFFSVVLFTVCLIFINSPTFAQDGELPEVINSVPKKVPLKVEIILPEKAEDFPEKIQVKVTNTGEKPIYAIKMILDIEDAVEKRTLIAPNGKPFYYGFDLNYGRRELQGVAKESPNERDIPIRPNESYLLKIDEKYAKTVKNNIINRGNPLPKIYRLVFFSLSYGDGTGYSGGSTYSKKN